MDARSLLRAKRQEAKVAHPYASYTTGALRCTVCAAPVKDGAAWDGHLGSKTHRKNVARVKEEQRLQDEALAQTAQREQNEAAERRAAKRPAEPEPVDAAPAKKQRTDSGFPSNFFTDSSRTLPAGDSEEEDEEDGMPTAASSRAVPTTAPPEPKSIIDLEWEAFQKDVVNADLAVEEKEDTYARATVAADAEMFDELEGFPAELAARRAAAQASTLPTSERTDMEQGEEEETEEQKRARKAQDERELIMDRILEEERAQEEADNKVTMMKARLELIKRQRAAKKTS